MNRGDFPTREELSLPAVFEEIVGNAMGGLIVVAGGRGSGVTTTLYWMMDCLNRFRRTHLMTFEDRIEIEMCHKLSMVSQRQRFLDFDHLPAALRQSRRQGAEAVMIAHLRTAEELHAAVQAAFSGQTVLAGMESDSVEGVINAFFQTLGASRWLTFCDALVAVCHQRLVKSCVGNRVPVVEVLRNLSGVNSVLQEKKWHLLSECRATGGMYGMRTLEQALVEAVKDGRIEASEALGQARDRARLEILLSDI